MGKKSSSKPAKQRITILSIDGGGIRGIIPAYLLGVIEKRTKQPICKLFDVIAGNYTAIASFIWFILRLWRR